MNRSQAKQQAAELLQQMTLEEKIAQMVQVSYADVSREEALAWAKRGAGSFLHVLGDNAREIQAAALKSRLGIPVIFGIDAIHGHGLNDHATIFPSQLACACSWNPESVRKMGEVTAREVATDGLHWTFSPVLCLGRDTRWGRVDETFGEDPYLAGELGAAIVRGYQGEDLSDDEHILACAKHYLGYGEATGGRDSYDTEVTERKIRGVFLPPFRKAVEAGCDGIELDVQLSSDGQVVVFHDDTLDRVCGVHGNVIDYSLADLRRMKLLDTEETIPLFTEVLDALSQGAGPVIVELKSGKRNGELCEKTRELLRAYPGVYCVESFDPGIVNWFRKNAPEIIRGQLAMPAEYYAAGTNPLHAGRDSVPDPGLRDPDL